MAKEIIQIDKPTIPKTWDYDKSVDKVKTFVYKWKNLTSDIVQELYIARELLRIPSEEAAKKHVANATRYSWTQYCDDIGVDRSTVHRWLDSYFPRPKKEIPPAEKEKLQKKLVESGQYNVIYADPPWDVKAGPGWSTSGASRHLEYPTMSIEEITALPVKKLAYKDAHLYVWTINKYIEETYSIVRAWGFEPSCMLTWCKPPHGIGLGGTYVQTTEHLLFARRGTLEANKRIDTTWFEYKRGKHSEKPNEFRKMIEEVSPGRKIEMFARTAPEGWDVWGNQV